MRSNVFAILTLMLFASTSYGAHPLITDDAGTMGKSESQLEINTEVSYDKETTDSVETKAVSQELAATLTYGIADHTDVVVGVPYQWLNTKEDGVETSDVNGLSDISVELKWRFYEADGLGLALKTGVTLPSGDAVDGLGNGEVSYSLTFITTKELSSSALHLNAAYMRNEYELQTDEDANRNDLWHLSLAVEIEVAEDLVAMANIGAERNPDKTSDTHPFFVLGGVVYSISDSIDIDLGVKGGLNKPETDYALLTGIVLKL